MARRAISAGDLYDRVTFQEPVEGDDGHAGTVTSFIDRFSVRANLTPLFGARLTVENVAAERLRSAQPYNITVRASSDTRRVTAAWRIYDTRAGLHDDGRPKRPFNIKTVTDPDGRRQFLELLAVEGEAG